MNILISGATSEIALKVIENMQGHTFYGLTRDKNLNSNLKTEIQINLVPTGEIISSTIIKGSGNKIFDDSALSAVLKVRSFEGLNMQMNLFDQHFREFILIFSPN